MDLSESGTKTVLTLLVWQQSLAWIRNSLHEVFWTSHHSDDDQGSRVLSTSCLSDQTDPNLETKGVICEGASCSTPNHSSNKWFAYFQLNFNWRTTWQVVSVMKTNTVTHHKVYQVLQGHTITIRVESATILWMFPGRSALRHFKTTGEARRWHILAQYSIVPS